MNQMGEVLPQFSRIFIPRNKESAWVYKKGSKIELDESKEHQGIWAAENKVAALQKSPIELWLFMNDKHGNLTAPTTVLENNPNQGKFGYDPSFQTHSPTTHLRNTATPEEKWFFPPKAKLPKNFLVKGIWVKPEYKRDMPGLTPGSPGFFNVGGKASIHKGGNLVVGGGWKMLGVTDKVVKKKKRKSPVDNGNGEPKEWEIFVRIPKGEIFPLTVIPSNKIIAVKGKVETKTGRTPTEEDQYQQRLYFQGNELMDQKTVVGSGIRNGDTIDMGTMQIYVRTKKGKKYTLDVTPEELIEDVLKMVQGKLKLVNGTPVDKPILHFKTTRLLPSKTLSNYKVRHKNVIDLGGMMIYIEPNSSSTTTPKGDADGTIQLDVETSDTIESVKKRVQTRTGVPIAKQHFFLEGKELGKDDARSLTFYNVQHLDTLVLGGMKINIIKDWNKQKSCLVVEPKYTIEHVKKMIEKKEGIPVTAQRLTFKGKSVYNAKTLEKSKIKHNSTLHLEGKKINIRTTANGGDTLTLDVDPNETIDSIKAKIQAEKGLPKESQKLFFNNNKLDNDKTLADYKIPHGAPLELIEDMKMDIEIIPDELRRGGSRIKLSVLPTHTIDDIKDLILEKAGIPKSRQRLFYQDVDDKELDGDLPLSKTKIKHGATLEIRPPEIKVKISGGGKSRVFIMDPEESVKDFKKKVAKKIGITFGQRLLLNGEDLDDDKKLSDHNLKHGDVLILEPSEIDIELPGMGKIKLAIFPTHTIDDIKDLILEKAGIPKSRQRLFYQDGDDKELDGNLPLSKTKIKHGATLEIRPPEIKVKTSGGGKSRVFIMDPEESVKDFKKKVAKKIGITLGQRLLLNGEDLDDDKKLSDHNLKHGDVLILEPSEIDIELPGMGKIKLAILPTHTIDDIKDLILEKAGIPKSRQRLFYLDGLGNDEELADTTPFVKLKFDHGVQLELRPFEIAVKHWNGDTFTLDSEPTEYIDDIKDRIQELKNIPIDQQRLTFQGQPVDDTLTLKEQNIGNQSTLVLEPMQINVKIPDGRELTFVVELGDTIERVKGLVSEKAGFQVDDKCLLFGGKELTNDRTLSEYNVDHDDILIMEIFQINIAHWSGDIFALADIHPNDTIEDVKGIILKMKKIPKDQQQFKFDGKLVHEKKTLEDHEIKHKSILTMEEPRQINIKLPKREKFTLTVFPTTTIADVKKVIEEKIPGMSIKKQRLFFLDNEEELDDATPFVKLKFDHGVQLELRPFEIVVKHWNGDTFTLDSEPTEYIDDIKDRIQELKNIPIDQQRLTFQGQPVDDTLTLKEQNIGNQSTLVLEPMQINVKIPDGRELTFVVELGYTIERVKGLVSEKAGFQVDDKCLLFGGKELTNDGTLSEYNVDHAEVLTMETFAISVMHWSGDIFALADIHPNNTVGDVKKRIVKMKKIPIYQLRITFEGQPVKDELKLKDQRIMHKSVLVLEPPSDGDIQIPEREKVFLNLAPRVTLKNVTNEEEIWPVMPDWKRRMFFFDNDEGFDNHIEITVMHWSGDTFTFDDVRLNETVGDIKERIAKLKKSPRHRLKVEGKVVDDNKSLVAQNIHHKSVLLMESLQQKKIDMPRTEKINFGLFSTKTVEKINIRIKYWNGDTFSIDFEPTEYIADVKDRIQELKNIPIDQQRISFQGQPVDDTLTLKEQTIVHQSTLVLEPMKIHVANPDGKQLTFVVELDDTIKRVKRLVWEKAGGQVDDQCLLFGGKELTNDRTLSECNVDHDDIITMETFAISVMHWSGDIFALADIRPNNTVDDVKNRIVKMKKIPKDQQQFKFEGKLVNETKTLKDQEIMHKSILIMEEARQINTTLPKRKKVTLCVFPTGICPKTHKEKFRDQNETEVDFISEIIARASGKPDTTKNSTDNVNAAVNLNGNNADEISAGPKGTKAKKKKKKKDTKGSSSKSASPKSTKTVSSVDASNFDDVSPKGTKKKKKKIKKVSKNLDWQK